MYRVLLVDDEPLALEGLQLLIDWQAYGFEVMGAYGDAAQALDAIERDKPDLVATDLYMPGLNGLDMMDAARKRGYAGRFIIVSGYNDFEMARRSLRLGVSGYLLKPIELTEAEQTLIRVREELTEAELNARQSDAFPDYQAQLTALLSGLDYQADAMSTLSVWQLVTWGRPIPYAESLRLIKPLHAGGAQCSLHMVEQREWLVLRSPKPVSQRELDGLASQLKTQRRQPAICPPTDNASELLDQCRGQLERMERCGEALSERTSDVIHYIKLLDRDQALERTEELEVFALSQGGQAPSQAASLMREGCVRLFADQPEALERFTESSGNALELRAMAEMSLLLLSPQNKRLSDEVMHIAQRRFDQNITLDEVAGRLGYNAAYLGRLFRKETNLSFRGWLCEYRMTRAAELLRGTQIPVSDIAQSVGYQKYGNFLEHFKGQFGITPEQYRKGGQ